MTEITELLIVLAGVMESEAAILGDDAMLAVGHVYLNRMTVPLQSYGDNPEKIAVGFHGYYDGYQASQQSMDLAWWLLVERWGMRILADSTHNSKYILSHQDVMNMWPENYQCVMNHAIWKSRLRVVDGIIYRLYSYRRWPVGLPYADVLCQGDAHYVGQ